MPRIRRTFTVAVLFHVLVAESLLAQDTTRKTPAQSDSAKPHVLQSMKISGRIDDLVGVAVSASEGHVGAAELRLRPITREGELLEAVPGMIVTQHSGEGKANQYFVRGFNLDHGTDFQTKLDGMPINMPTHRHGQGYTDLNFLIPELVDNIDYKLGVYHAELGDFGSAGGAEFHLVQSLNKPFVTAGTGANGLARFATGGSSHIGNGDLLFGGEAVVQRAVGSGRGHSEVQRSQSLFVAEWRLAVFDARDGLSQQVEFERSDPRSRGRRRPRLAIWPDRFHRRRRVAALQSLRHVAAGVGRDYRTTCRLTSYARTSPLFSDFTYFLDNPTRGDQFNQTDHRTIVGGTATHAQPIEAFGTSHFLRSRRSDARRHHRSGWALSHPTARSLRHGPPRQGERGRQRRVLEAESRWTPRFRTVLGARADVYSFDVTSSLTENSGKRTASIASRRRR